jgi:hypothetical protein
VPVYPVEVRASAERRGHPAGAVEDTLTDTYWAAAATPDLTITMRFEHPVELRKVNVWGGVSGNLGATSRPHLAYLLYSNGKAQNLDLNDRTDKQEFDLDSGGAVISLVLHITTWYPAVGSPDLALTEFELLMKK